MLNKLLKHINVDVSKLKMKRETRRFDHFDQVSFMVPPAWLTRIKRFPRLGYEQRLLSQGDVVAKGFRPLACDLIYEKDVSIGMRDGITLYGDVFRPTDSDKKYPVVLAWTPYGKVDPPLSYDVFPNRAHMRKELGCGLDTFEGPEPDYWVRNGYVVAVIDSRGSTHSEGDFHAMGHEEAKDIHDAIEWLGTQPWSNGKVGMTGNSWLAISQYFAAAEHPKHLTAIAPWEGFSDLYRDHLCWGGIPTTQFANKLGMFFRLRPGAAAEDFTTMLSSHPGSNDYWEKDKRPDFDQIEVPMYVVASWTSNIHPYGTFRAWKLAKSENKWLRVHNTQEWPDYATPKYRDELRDFFDRYLKGLPNNWESTPRVRVSLLDTTGPDLVDLPATDFPLPDTRVTRLYLEANDMQLEPTAPSAAAQVSYPAGNERGKVEFRFTVPDDLKICGYIKARLYVSTDVADDMDLFLYVSKEDSIGVAHPPQILGVEFMGAESRLRVSHRRVLDATPWDWKYESTPAQPLQPGRIAELDAIFWPIGMTWRKGESLVLSISSTNLQKIEFPAPPIPTINRGKHSVHTGPEHLSYIEIPCVS